MVLAGEGQAAEPEASSTSLIAEDHTLFARPATILTGAGAVGTITTIFFAAVSAYR